MALQWPFVNEEDPKTNGSGQRIGSNKKAKIKKHYIRVQLMQILTDCQYYIFNYLNIFYFFPDKNV